MNLLDNKLICDYFSNYHPKHNGKTSLDAATWLYNMIVTPYLSKPNIYHNYKNHIEPMLNTIELWHLPENIQFILFFFSIFHDVVHEVGRDDEINVTESIELLHKLCNTTNYDEDDSTGLMYKQLFKTVVECIEATKYNFDDYNTLSSIQKIAIKLDIYPMINGNLSTLYKNQMLLFKEYQYIHPLEYKNLTEKFLIKFKSKFITEIQLCNNIDIMIDMIKNFNPKIGIFCGSFLPYTIGHDNILKQAEQIFDKVVIAIGNNNTKQNINIDNSLDNLPNQIDEYDGLLSTYIEESYKDCDVTVIRGLRNGNDLQYEENLKSTILDINSNIKIIYFLCDKKISHISSSMVRELSKYKSVEQYLV